LIDLTEKTFFVEGIRWKSIAESVGHWKC